jgi:hypothetical protein
VQPGPNCDREPAGTVKDRKRATDATGRAVKGGEEPVSGRLDLTPSVTGKLSSNHLVVSV